MRLLKPAPAMLAAAKAREIEAELRSLAKEPVVILISGHPDPDAIGSALAHQRLCRRLGLEATIAHVLPISRSENRALVELLEIKMLRVGEARDLEHFSHMSLVDTRQAEATIELPTRLRLVTVVDHHSGTVYADAPFVDIRPRAGATSTIYAEYAALGTAPLRAEVADDVRVATALLFGIQTDTNDFALADSADFRAAAYLKPFCDTVVLDGLCHRKVATETMDVLGRALVDLTVVRNFALAGVGVVSPEHRDAIPAAADFILRREKIDTVIVYGIVAGRVDGSLRSNNTRLDPAPFLQLAFGSDDLGRPFGGGRLGKGGFQIPVRLIAPNGDSALAWTMVQDAIRLGLSKVVSGLDAVGLNR